MFKYTTDTRIARAAAGRDRVRTSARRRISRGEASRASRTTIRLLRWDNRMGCFQRGIALQTKVFFSSSSFLMLLLCGSKQKCVFVFCGLIPRVFHQLPNYLRLADRDGPAAAEDEASSVWHF